MFQYPVSHPSSPPGTLLSPHIKMKGNELLPKDADEEKSEFMTIYVAKYSLGQI